MDDVRKLTAKELEHKIRHSHRSHNLNCTADEYNAMWAELLRRLDSPAGRFGELLEALKLAIVCQTCEGTGEVTLPCPSCEMDGMGTCTCGPEPCMECNGRKWSCPDNAVEAVTKALALASPRPASQQEEK